MNSPISNSVQLACCLALARLTQHLARDRACASSTKSDELLNALPHGDQSAPSRAPARNTPCIRARRGHTVGTSFPTTVGASFRMPLTNDQFTISQNLARYSGRRFR